MDGAILLGRLLLIGLFVFSGVGKLMDLPSTAGAIGSKGLPAPMVLAAIAGAVEVIGAALIAVGWNARLGALALIGYTVVATYFFHNFWDMEGPQRMQNIIAFNKNAALIGGLLLLIGFGPGRYSVDGGREPLRSY